MSGFVRGRFTDPFRFSGCRVTKGTPGNFPTSNTAVTFDTEDYDTDAYHDTGSNTSRLTAPTTGYYVVDAALDAVGGDNHWFYIFFRVNGSGLPSPLVRPHCGSDGSGYGWNLSHPMSLTATDYVEMILNSSDADAINRITFAIHHLGT